MQCYLVDIDGTIANGEHRVHLILKEPKNWDAYFELCHADEPIPHIVRLLQDLVKAGATLVFVSGRSSIVRGKTEAWLHSLALPTDHLYMRLAGDHRNDDVLKIEMLAEIRAAGFVPIMAFDDRNRVVEAWRKAGVPCAQVAAGDF